MTMPVEKRMGLNNRNNENSRRASKPLMEKRRRARINQSLAELKTLIFDTNRNQDSAEQKTPGSGRHSKLEKADILEMTVVYMRNLIRRNPTGPDVEEANSYEAGFSECAREVARFVSRAEGVDPGLRNRLFKHLSIRIFPNHIEEEEEEDSNRSFDSERTSSESSSSNIQSIVERPVTDEDCSNSSSSISAPSRDDHGHQDIIDLMPMDLAANRSQNSDLSRFGAETKHRMCHLMMENEQKSGDEPVWRPW